MRRRPIHAVLLAIACAGCSSTPSSPTGPNSGDPAGPGDAARTVAASDPAEQAPAETLDSGTFVISMGGAEIGKESFHIARRGQTLELHNDSSLTVAGQALHGKGQLVTDREWHPQSGQTTVELGGQTSKQTLSRDSSGQLVTTIDSGQSQPTTIEAKGEVELYIANNTFIHFAPVCALASDDKRTVSVFPAGTLELSPRTTRTFASPVMGQPDRELGHVSGDLVGATRIDFYCEGDRLVALSIALAGITAVRQEYQDIAGALAAKPRPKPATPADLVDLDRSVTVAAAPGVEPATLDCSLMLPASHAAVKTRKKRGPSRALPAVVFISGSGPQDRDEDSAGPGGLKLGIFKVMAIALGQAGIASLRCDDRGTGKSTGSFETATLDTFVADARAMVAALRDEPAVNPGRVGMIGHSEGAIVTPIVAAGDTALAALVLMAGPGRPLDVIIREQMAWNLRNQGLTQEKIDEILAEARATHDAIREDRPLPESEASIQSAWMRKAAPWLRSHFVHDPAATAARLGKIPVFIAQGAKDVQVSVKDAEILRDTLRAAGNQKVRYTIYPELNHLFAASKSGSLAEYSDPDAQVAPAFVADVVEFLKKHL